MTLTQTPPRPALPAIPRLTLRRDEQRALAIELEALLEDRLATRTQRFRCGTALFNEDYPRAGALNVLRVDGDVPAVEPEALMSFVDQLQSGLPQRSIRIVDDEHAAQLRPGFAAAGWVATQRTLMAPRRIPDRPVDVSAIREVPLEQLRQARAITLRREHRDLDSAEQLESANVLPAGDVELRCFAATVGTEVAAYAVARVRGEVAKLTELDAFARSQGQGLGRAVIWGAVSRLREAGVRTLVVEADDGSWPQWTFRRLGFEEIGHTHRFVRPWGGESAPPPA